MLATRLGGGAIGRKVCSVHRLDWIQQWYIGRAYDRMDEIRVVEKLVGDEVDAVSEPINVSGKRDHLGLLRRIAHDEYVEEPPLSVVQPRLVLFRPAVGN